MAVLLVVGLGYLLGSIPSGLVAGRLQGVDLRQRGSGRTGATNALRTLGPALAALVLAADVAKGAMAVALAPLVLEGPMAQVGAALGAVAGHNWPLFSRFQGGRGVAPALGGQLVMAPWVAMAGLAAFALAILASRYVSLGSLVGTTATGAILVVQALAQWGPWEYAVYGVAGATIVVVQHRDNIARLLAGRERRLGQEG
jgi:glycerol-3-phosphate acyltransferase PlsY